MIIFDPIKVLNKDLSAVHKQQAFFLKLITVITRKHTFPLVLRKYVALFTPLLFSDSYPQCTCWFPGLKYTTKSRGLSDDSKSSANIRWPCKPQLLSSMPYCTHTQQRLRQWIRDVLTYVIYNARLYISYMGMVVIELHTLWLQIIDIINLKYKLHKIEREERPYSTK